MANYTSVKVIAIYDVVKAPMIKNLTRGFQVERTFGDQYCYMHISQILAKQQPKHEKKSTMASDVLEHLNKIEKDKHNLLTLPYCFTTLKGYDRTINGDEYTLEWTDN